MRVTAGMSQRHVLTDLRRVQERLANAQDFHVGVVTSDDYHRNEAGCGKIGSLVTRTGGPQSSNQVCGP